MEGRPLASDRTGGPQAPNAHLPSLTPRRWQDGPQTATTLGEVPRGAAPGRPAGDPGQPGQAHGRGGRGQVAPPHPTTRAGPEPGAPPNGVPGAAGPHPQTRLRG